KSLIAIENQAPALLASARENLADSLPKPYVETAVLVANGAADYMQKELLDALKDLQNDSLRKAFEASNKTAIAELRNYAAWLQKEKLKKVHNRYAIGTENYRKVLLYNEMLDVDPADILKMGLAELKKEQD